MMENSANVYVLTSLSLDAKGDVQTRNIGVTFSLHEAERHRSKAVESSYECFPIASNWREDVAATDLVVAMRVFCDMVKELQQDAEFRRS